MRRGGMQVRAGAVVVGMGVRVGGGCRVLFEDAGATAGRGRCANGRTALEQGLAGEGTAMEAADRAARWLWWMG